MHPVRHPRNPSHFSFTSPIWELVTPPTCTEEGYTTHTCSVCGNSYVDCYVNPRGHSWDKGRVTTPPKPAKPGVKTYVCTRCNENRTESIGPWPNPFVDVEEGRYYYTPVLWAVYAGVASGIDRTHFMPEQTCTRGQVVTFLWRAKGCPAPESAQCPFLDVTPKRYYYDAVLWAAEQGITAGVDATHFNPEGVVTRGQLVTFLWRAGGCPAVSGRNPFVDVTQDRFYYDAVLWAAARGITLGIDATHFMPNRSCTGGRSPPSSSGSRKDNLAPVGISERAMATCTFYQRSLLISGSPFSPCGPSGSFFLLKAIRTRQKQEHTGLGRCRQDMSAAFPFGRHCSQ